MAQNNNVRNFYNKKSFIKWLFARIFIVIFTLIYPIAHGKRSLKSEFDNLFENRIDEYGYFIQKDCFPHYIEVISDQTPLVYTVTDEPLTVTFPAFRAYPGSCNITYSILGEAASIVRITDQQAHTLTISAVEDYALFKGEREVTLQVPLQGKIGAFFTVTTLTHFELRLQNPCFKPDYVQISTLKEVPEIQSPDGVGKYAIYKPPLEWIIPTFPLITRKKIDFAFCGEIYYEVFLNAIKIDNSTEPVTYHQKDKKVRIYTEKLDEVGAQIITVTGFFSKYPEVRSKSMKTRLEILYNACPFEDLVLLPNPFQNQYVTLYEEGMTQSFHMQDLAERTSFIKCGKLAVKFSAISIGNKPVATEFFEWNQDSYTIKRLQTRALSLSGLFKVHYEIYLEEYPFVNLHTSTQYFIVYVRDPCTPQTNSQDCFTRKFQYESTPQWMKKLNDQVIVFGQDFNLEIGKPVDNFDQAIPIEINFGEATNFLSFQEDSFVIDGSMMHDETIPRYLIIVETFYEDVFGQQQYFKRQFHLQIIHLIYPNIEFTDKIYFTGDPSIDFSLPDSNYNTESSHGKGPEIFVIGKSHDGRIKLGWSVRMKQVTDPNALLKERVAVPMPVTEPRRDSVIVFNREQRTFGRFHIRRAVEVDYISSHEDVSPVPLSSVEITNFKSHQMTILAMFNQTEQVEYDDYIRITFWKSDSFKSEETRFSLYAGTEIFVPVSLQIDQDAEDPLNLLLIVLCILVTIMIVLSLVLRLFYGSILPVWMFINSLQLIIYTVLLDIPQSSKAAYFMHKVLDGLRLRFLYFNSHDDQNDIYDLDLQEAGNYNKMINSQNNFHRLHLQVLGYRPWLYSNIAPLVYIFCSILLIWLSISLYWSLQNKGKNKANLQKVISLGLNCLTRLGYEAFLELCICVLLALSLAFSTLELVFAWGLFLCILASLVGVCILFTGRGGPSHPAIQAVCCQYRIKMRSELIEHFVKDLMQDRERHDKEKNELRVALKQKRCEKEKQDALTQQVDAFMTDSNDCEGQLELSPQQFIFNDGKIQLGKMNKVQPELFDGGETEIGTNLHTERNNERIDTARGLLTEEDQAKKIHSNVQASQEAIKRSIIEDQMILKPQYKTLFNGLKLSHPDFIAATHPLYFLLRRVLYAIAIVFMAEYGLIAAILLQLACLAQLCLTLNYRQWKDPFMHYQHVFNEISLHLILTLQISCATSSLNLSRQKLGNGIILVICVTLTWNIAVCIYCSSHYASLIVQKNRNKYKLQLQNILHKKTTLKAVTEDKALEVMKEFKDNNIQIDIVRIDNDEENIKEQTNQYPQHSMGQTDDNLVMQTPIDDAIILQADIDSNLDQNQNNDKEKDKNRGNLSFQKTSHHSIKLETFNSNILNSVSGSSVGNLETNDQMGSSQSQYPDILSNKSREVRKSASTLLPVEEADDSLLDRIQTEIKKVEGIDWNDKFTASLENKVSETIQDHNNLPCNEEIHPKNFGYRNKRQNLTNITGREEYLSIERKENNEPNKMSGNSSIDFYSRSRVQLAEIKDSQKQEKVKKKSCSTRKNTIQNALASYKTQVLQNKHGEKQQTTMIQTNQTLTAVISQLCDQKMKQRQHSPSTVHKTLSSQRTIMDIQIPIFKKSQTRKVAFLLSETNLKKKEEMKQSSFLAEIFKPMSPNEAQKPKTRRGFRFGQLSINAHADVGYDSRTLKSLDARQSCFSERSMATSDLNAHNSRNHNKNNRAFMKSESMDVNVFGEKRQDQHPSRLFSDHSRQSFAEFSNGCRSGIHDPTIMSDSSRGKKVLQSVALQTFDRSDKLKTYSRNQYNMEEQSGSDIRRQNSTENIREQAIKEQVNMEISKFKYD